jgi:hypothetical protein
MCFNVHVRSFPCSISMSRPWFHVHVHVHVHVVRVKMSQCLNGSGLAITDQGTVILGDHIFYHNFSQKKISYSQDFIFY